MLPRSFQYLAPKSLEEASNLLKEHHGEAKILAGGMSLIPLMKMRLASPGYVVDINRVKGLDYIKLSDDGRSLLIGPLARHHSVEASPLVRERAPLLAEAAGSIGDPQVRNLGTIGGALAHSDPSGDWGTAVLAMRGTVKVLGQAGERDIPIDDFLVDTFTTALKDDELIVQVSIPLASDGKSGAAYLKLERKAGDFATVAVAAQITLERGKEGLYFTYAGIGLTAVGPKNLRAKEAERSLLGMRATKETILESSLAAARECSPVDDPLRGSANYKREMVGLFTRRAIELAVARAQHGKERAAR